MIKTLFQSLFRLNVTPVADTQADLEQQTAQIDSRGDARASISLRQDLLKLHPDRLELWVSLAKIQRSSGDLHGAANSFRQALCTDSQNLEALLLLSAVLTELEDFSSAEETLRKLVALAPTHADAWCMLGVVCKDRGRYDEAFRCLKTSVEHSSDLAPAWFNLGLVQFEQGKLADARLSFMRSVALLRGPQWSLDTADLSGQDPSPALDPEDMAVNVIKLRHDCEQLEYLLQSGKLPQHYYRVLDEYRILLKRITGSADENTLFSFDAQQHPLVAKTYKRPIYIAKSRISLARLINPDLNFSEIEDRYLAAKPNVVTIDQLLTPQALESVRLFCRESTIWNNIKPGYLGAYFYDGFCSHLLLRLAWELRASMPRVIRDLPLNMMWGFKCDATLPGLAVHADAAAVNINFWITENGANLDPAGGGLLVYEHDAPGDWDFRHFNHDSSGVQAYLDSVDSLPTRYPYRENRAVIFDSDLFHATDSPQFRTGYLNRRINITLLYGNRKT